MMDVLDKIAQLKLVPVVKLDRAEDAVPLAQALCDGQLPVAEITFRTDAAAASIEKIAAQFPEMLVGAGTVVNPDQAARALDAGARFLVSAGFSRKVTEFAIDHKVPIFPGACTPTELLLLQEYGLPVAKFFPASQFGGLATIKALAAPFPAMKFMPTGGISADNLLDYLAYPKIVACGGSWMVKDELIKSSNFDRIRTLTQQAVDLIATL